MNVFDDCSFLFYDPPLFHECHKLNQKNNFFEPKKLLALSHGAQEFLIKIPHREARAVWSLEKKDTQEKRITTF